MCRMLTAARVCSETATLDDDWREKIAARSKVISGFSGPSRLNVFLFHQGVPTEAAVISTPDIKDLDHGAIDYEGLLRFNIAIALWSNPTARILLFTDKTFFCDYPEHPRVSIVRLDVLPCEPMFERVVTMAAYVSSLAFNAPTVFLDSDAFLIRPMSNIFANNFDVAVTYRANPGMMPINEGVIYVNDRDPNAVIRFFRRYLATYLRLENMPDVIADYGNIRRWRGGQLSINGVSGAQSRYARSIRITHDAIRLAYLPCSQFNLSDISEQEITRALIDRCAVLHLKGNRKSWLDRLRLVLRDEGFVP